MSSKGIGNFPQRVDNSRYDTKPSDSSFSQQVLTGDRPQLNDITTKLPILG